MNNITIVLPYENAETQTVVWACMEKEIDFRNDLHNATKCTVAFAATELKYFLGRTLQNADISFSSTLPSNGVYIELKLIDEQSISDKYMLETIAISQVGDGCCSGNLSKNSITITGYGRAGVLYGAYQLLKLQGWRWYAPGQVGEIAPLNQKELILPIYKTEYAPTMIEGRGFDFEGDLRDSEDLWLWMARNRLNIATYRYYTVALQNKLCMQFKNGGHIFEKILHPDRVLPSGKTIWEEHIDWYGLPENGERIKEKALAVQFCVSNNELVEFLANELLHKLNTDWRQAHRIDIWGFDTWGNTCSCDKCKALGNSSDQTLHFLSLLRGHINNAIKEKCLEHNVRLIMCAYGGTATLEAPLNSIPKNLADAQDMVVFYPITRCYAHDFSDDTCPENSVFNKCLSDWSKLTPALPIVIGEYYNVSKFEDLPLLFTNRMSNDIPYYAKHGVRAITYMHLPMLNWAMRTLNQVLYAELAWDTNADADKIINEYLKNWYEAYAWQMKTAYQLIEDAWVYSSNLRSWSSKSILSQLMIWDGSKPQNPLVLDMHFKDHSDLIEKCRQSIEMLQKALEIISGIRQEIKNTHVQNNVSITRALNPTDLAKLCPNTGTEFRIAEDYRQIIYGLDTMMLMTSVIEYYDALYSEVINNDNISRISQIWQSIEQTAEKLDSYYIPLTYDWPKVGLSCKDALTRTQLRDVIKRCRVQRK